ncbi:PAS domain S-box protein [Skermanella mucosa]|uniref:PAS domain S-box protein n=1 Tax=Skermanella mucosa TaxID=1789672 RepID=UPI001E3786F5|nr:PAS domain S-box protein [Skermanella mucosa]
MHSHRLPQISQVMAGGEPTWHENQLVPIIRNGRREDVYWTYSYGPINDASALNGVGGVLVLCTETTQVVVSRRTSEERFRTLAKASSEVFYRMSPDWTEMRQLYGRDFLSDTEGVSTTWLTEYIHPDDQPHVWGTIQEAIRTKGVFDLEHRVRQVDGTLGWAHSRAAPILDTDGEVTEWFGVASNVTPRKQAEEAVRASEERLRNAFAIRTVGVMFWGQGFGLTEVNDAFLTMTGFSREEALGLTWQELTPEEFHQASLKAVEEVATLGESTPYEKQYFRKDGSRWWGLFAARRIGDEVVEFVLDVTRRKLAKAALRETEQRFRLVVENARDYAIFITDEQDTITDWFPGAANVFGWSAEEIVGQSSTILFTPEDREKKVPAWEFDTARREGAAPNVRWHLRKDGQRVFIEGQNVALRHTNGSLRGFLKIGQDVTARHAAEMALRASRDEAEEANRAKSRFLAAASHDLRQPVTAANLYMDLLQRRLAAPDHRNLADLVRTSLDGLLGLLNGLLEIARLDAGIVQPDMQLVALDDLLHRLCLEFEAQAQAARLWLQVPPTSAVVSTDRLLLELILRNLIGNALKYTQRGGVSVETLEDDDTVRIDIRDTGTGIPKDLLDRIFDDFYQAGDPAGQSRGFGIGLATVRRATRALDCRLEVESKPGRGSVFSIWLPKAEEGGRTRLEPVPVPATDVEDLSGHTILMVEDDLLIGMALAMELEETGLTIVRANRYMSTRMRQLLVLS